MTKFTVVGPMTKANETCHVHIAGCRDLRNLRVYRGQEKVTVDAASPIEAAFAAVLDSELGYTASDAKIFPCCEAGMAKAERDAEPALPVDGHGEAIEADLVDAYIPNHGATGPMPLTEADLAGSPAPAPAPEGEPVSDQVMIGLGLGAFAGLPTPSEQEKAMSDQAAPEIEFDQTVPEAEPVAAPEVEAAPEAETDPAPGGLDWADVGLSTPTGLTKEEKEMAKKSARKLTPAPKPAKGKRMTAAESLALSAKVGAQTKKMGGKAPAKAAKPAKAEKAPKAAKAPKAPASPKAPKVKRLELTSRQREVLREDAKDSGLKADVEAGKQIRLTAGSMKDITAFAGSDKDATRQRVYVGLLARCAEFVKANGLL